MGTLRNLWGIMQLAGCFVLLCLCILEDALWGNLGALGVTEKE